MTPRVFARPRRRDGRPETRRGAGPCGRPHVLRTGFVAVALAAIATLCQAQAGRNMERPPHWKLRAADTTEEAERSFVVMRPGWHIFSGPGTLLWDPASFASGDYRVTSEMFLFPPDVGAPYGMFLGGGELEGDSGSWLSFEIRNDRRFRVARHAGMQVRELVPWTEHPDIVAVEPTNGGPVENRLAVDVRDAGVAFYINEVHVAELPRSGLPTDGAIGLFVGDALSVHFTSLDIGPNR